MARARLIGIFGRIQAATNVWGDAYLAAYAAVNGATLVTFDKRFAKFPLKCLMLGPLTAHSKYGYRVLRAKRRSHL